VATATPALAANPSDTEDLSGRAPTDAPRRWRSTPGRRAAPRVVRIGGAPLHPGRRGALPRTPRAGGDRSTSDGGEPSRAVPGVEARRRPRGGEGAAHQAAGRSTRRPRRGKSPTVTPRRSSTLGRGGAIRCIPFGGGRPRPCYVGDSRRCASLTRRHRRRGPPRATVALCCGSSTPCVGGASRAVPES
jgi:hypothetical protein